MSGEVRRLLRRAGELFPARHLRHQWVRAQLRIRARPPLRRVEVGGPRNFIAPRMLREASKPSGVKR